MSRNNVRGPTSALTEFLKASGITPTTIARRARTRQEQEQPVAGPSGTSGNGHPDEHEDAGEAEVDDATVPRGRRRARTSTAPTNYDSDHLDDPEEPSPVHKKRKLTKAAEAKLKAKEKAKKGKKGDDDGDYDQSEEEDTYRALSKMWSGGDVAKPPVGSFENCAKCEKQFTVTKYTMAANPGPGFLCHQCAKASGADPFKKPATPKRRKAPAEKRNVVYFEEKRLPSLASMCIQLITKHIDDVEALGDIGAVNMDAISKALSKNRSLTPENAHLFYTTTNTSLTFYDATNLNSPALTTLFYLNPSLTALRLDFCGHLDDAAMSILSTSLPSLTSLTLLGPFLVRAPTWSSFINARSSLTTFRITQSPRFDLTCMQTLAASCGSNLTSLRLKEVGLLDDAFLTEIRNLHLEELDLAYPSKSCSEDALIELMEHIGAGLKLLDLSRHTSLSDDFLERGLSPYARHLESLTISHVPGLTDKGVGAFFKSWRNLPLVSLDMSRNNELGSEALMGVLRHSGKKLEVLKINGWKDVGEGALKSVGKLGLELRKIDVGWCREMDDFIVNYWMEGDGKVTTGCKRLKEVKVWGCNKITARCPRKQGVSVLGIESHTVL